MYTCLSITNDTNIIHIQLATVSNGLVEQHKRSTVARFALLRSLRSVESKSLRGVVFYSTLLRAQPTFIILWDVCHVFSTLLVETTSLAGNVIPLTSPIMIQLMSLNMVLYVRKVLFPTDDFPTFMHILSVTSLCNITVLHKV